MNTVPGYADEALLKSVAEWETKPDLKGIVYDSPAGDDRIYGAFPIFTNDSLEDVIRKYQKVFPEELKYTLKDFQEKKSNLNDPKGMSKTRNMRQMCTLPHTLGAIIQKYYPWYIETKEGMNKLKKLIPYCFI